MLMTALSAGLLGLGIMSAASLRAWSGWLELKRLELTGRQPRDLAAAGKPELADLKARVRKLEAIASGIETE